MEFIGKVIGMQKDFETGKYQIIFSVQEGRIKEEYEAIKTLDKLMVTVKKYRKKRSLDANAYLWVLLQKMAEKLKTDKWSLYLKMIAEYGQFTHVIVKPNAVEAVKRQWRECEELGEVTVNGVTGIQLRCYFGSSTYDTREMAVLLDGVIKEAESLEIEVLPPIEIERMKQQWGVNLS